MAHPGAFIIVEDEPILGAELVKVVALLRKAELVTTAAAAYQALAPERQWTGAIVDVGLPDASGLDVVERARALMPLLPMLVLTGQNDPHAINRAHELRCEFLLKPATMDDLLRFVERAICFEQVPDARLLDAARRFADECALTPREHEVVVLALGQRPKLHDALGVSLNTLKTLVKSILKKTGHDSLHSLSTAILRETLQGR